MSNEKLSYSIRIPVDYAGYRVDQAASLLLPDISRTSLRHCILTGELLINNQEVKPAQRLLGAELLELDMLVEQVVDNSPEEISLDLIYEDEDIAVVNKPTGMVVHPAVGNYSGTLLNALLFHFPEASLLPRAGIVHRLDKDTSGLLVVAKTEKARQSLIEQLKDKSMSRVYTAVCQGVVEETGEVDQPIGRHHVNRKKMAVVSSGKQAKTLYRVIEYFAGYSLLELQLTTGRTHQIRVHMHFIGHPVAGDQTYSLGKKHNQASCVSAFPRQALHATKLSLIHPTTGKTMKFKAPMPQDMLELIEQLRVPR